MNCNKNVIYIPPVETKYGVPVPINLPADSRVPDPMFSNTNPKCPITACPRCAGSNCKCYTPLQGTSYKRPYWVYKWNQY